MFVAAHEWSPPRDSAPDAQQPPAACPAFPRPKEHSDSDNLTRAPQGSASQALYQRLAAGVPDDAARADARAYVRQALAEVPDHDDELPEDPQDLLAWMRNSAQRVSAKYRHYLEERQAGAPRRYFSNRAHALYFLRSVAPTKLVDGAWLYGLLAHAGNPRFSGLVQTYVEELGEGQPDKNHVALYRRLLGRYGLDPIDDLDDSLYVQGVLQLGLGWNAEEFLPEIVGFNLGYEQLPLHLLITAYELNELGLDPYYFTLHITVDNEDSGHAHRAVQAVHDTLPRLGGAAASQAFWQRMRQGFQLGNAGVCTTQVIDGFDIGEEVVRILSRKSVAGHGAHSDYCRVAGRSVNDWLAQPGQIPGFLAALQDAGWIKRGAPVQDSRFWSLLQGERAEMFGVFSAYELQVIHDWIRGEASADGQPYAELGAPTGQRRASFRAAARLAAMRRPSALAVAPDETLAVLDPDLEALTAGLAATDDPAQRTRLLVDAMAPCDHWTPAGLHATRLFCQAGA